MAAHAPACWHANLLASRPSRCVHTSAGNRLWEWFSVGRWGLKGYNFKKQTFEGEAWPEEAGAP